MKLSDKFLQIQKKGDKNIFFRQLANAYYKKIQLHYQQNLCVNHKEAEDLTQEFFLKLFRIYNSCPEYFDKEPKHLNCSIFKIAKNFGIDYLRKPTTRQHIEEINSELHSKLTQCSSINSFEVVDWKEYAYRRLTKRQKKVFELLEKGYKYREIAEILSYSLAAVKNLILSGRRNLSKEKV